MTDTDFFLIRHAESVWNAAGRWQGHGDPSLSDRGLLQAEALARDLAPHPLDALVASDLMRATQTASALGRATGLSLATDPRLREIDIGSWTGLTRAEIAERDGDLLRRFEAGDAEARPGSGETRPELRHRARLALASLAAAYPGKSVAVVTHLGVIRSLLDGAHPDNASWRHVAASQIL